jgi:hypothetical protein
VHQQQSSYKSFSREKMRLRLKVCGVAKALQLQRGAFVPPAKPLFMRVCKNNPTPQK